MYTATATTTTANQLSICTRFCLRTPQRRTNCIARIASVFVWMLLHVQSINTWTHMWNRRFYFWFSIIPNAACAAALPIITIGYIIFDTDRTVYYFLGEDSSTPRILLCSAHRWVGGDCAQANESNCMNRRTFKCRYWLTVRMTVAQIATNKARAFGAEIIECINRT